MICELVALYLALKAARSLKVGPVYPSFRVYDADKLPHMVLGHHMPEKRGTPNHENCFGCWAR